MWGTGLKFVDGYKKELPEYPQIPAERPRLPKREKAFPDSIIEAFGKKD